MSSASKRSFTKLIAESIPEYSVDIFSINGKKVKKRRTTDYGKAVKECVQRFGKLLSVYVEGNEDLTRLIFAFASPIALLQVHLDKLAQECGYFEEPRRSLEDIVFRAKCLNKTFCHECYVLVFDAKDCLIEPCLGHACSKQLCDDCITHLRAKCLDCYFRDDRTRSFCDECARTQYFCPRFEDHICSAHKEDHECDCRRCGYNGVDRLADAETDSEDDLDEDFEE